MKQNFCIYVNLILMKSTFYISATRFFFFFFFFIKVSEINQARNKTVQYQTHIY